MNKSPAAFDYDKLGHINSEHIKRLTAEERLELARPIIAARGWELDPAWQVAGAGDTGAFLARVLATLGNRFSSLLTLPDQIGFFFTDDHFVDEEARVAHAATDEEPGPAWRPWPRPWPGIWTWVCPRKPPPSRAWCATWPRRGA